MKPVVTQEHIYRISPTYNISLLEVSSNSTGQCPTEHLNLNDSYLACGIMQGATWERRKKFVETVLIDVLRNCPKNEPLVMVSMGSNQLLIEYIVALRLIANGYRELKIMAVDPSYKHGEKVDLERSQVYMGQFREKIEAYYYDVFKEHLPKEAITFLSRAYNVTKHLPQHSNIVVIESIPSYAEHIRKAKEEGMIEKKPKDLFAGSFVVTKESANGIAFIPRVFLEPSLDFSVIHTVPYLPLPHKHSYFDWGCKIRSDGKYRLSFQGGAEYYNLIRLNQNSDEAVAVEEISKFKNTLETLLSRTIKGMQNVQSEKKLTQKNMSDLLEAVQRVTQKVFPDLAGFFTADYMIDRKDLFEELHARGSHRYCKSFTLRAIAGADFETHIEEI